ncbi:MAG: class II fumarate hydratase [Acidobacteria bacterium]|nr:class II fumarate hydratase [Acidobacteriota bacterium]TDI48764.1 MAG: class II fumarate hydratase [Acidobacteriota bacterium]
MGEVKVPADAMYGASTQRAVDNFPISNHRFGRRFIWALGLLKGSAGTVAGEMDFKSPAISEAIRKAADQVMAGDFDDQFVLDIFQTGSGTSTNTNANEVIATRATEVLGDTRVHPNDDVNFGQSSNDVIPTAIHVSAVAALREDLLPALDRLAASLEAKADEFSDVVKSGRTHLMDATPVTLGQEFGGYATQVRKGAQRVEVVLPELEELALGGTAVGTGINAPDGFAAAVIALMAERTGYSLREADDHFEAQGAKDATVSASGALRTVAVSLFKIANDIRFLGSGPTSGISEIKIPSLQPGSSIMPGKVNPVMSEMMMQVAAQVVGNDVAIAWGGANGNFELNVMMPMIAHNLLESAGILANGCDAFRERCVDGLEANEKRAQELVEKNAIIVTALNPHIGYDNGAKIAKEAVATGRSVRELVLEAGLMTEDELDDALDIKKMTEGGLR